MSLSISKHVFAKLSESKSLKSLVEDKIFPLSTKESTTFPFIVYMHNSVIPSYTKDRHATGDSVEVEVVIASDNYFNAVEIAEVVRATLEKKKGSYTTFRVIDAKMLRGEEAFTNDTFIKRLIFSFDTETE